MDILKITTIFLALFFACCGTTNKDITPKERFEKATTKGHIAGNITCKDFPGQSYSIFLPSNYSIEKSYPVIFFFDPHGDGKLPLKKYQSLAEQYGLIFIGSNNSKNGIQQNELKYIIDAIIKDTKEKVAVDTTQMYVAGFSGGARVAALAAIEKPYIKGVIACSAGFTPDKKTPFNFDFAGIAGYNDMNYLEVKYLVKFLDNFPARHCFFEFQGKHEWPPVETFNDALFWMFYGQQKWNMSENKDTVIKNYFDSLNKRINTFLPPANAEKTEMALSLLSNANQIFADNELTRKFNEIKTLALSSDFETKTKDAELYEQNKQKEYSAQFPKPDLNYWKKEIKNIESASENKENPFWAQANKRLFAYLGLISYSYVNSVLNEHNTQAADYFLEIYKLVGSDNPDYYYFNACNLVSGHSKNAEAIQSLKEAINLGFTDFKKMKNDPMLTPLLGDTAFQNLNKKGL